MTIDPAEGQGPDWHAVLTDMICARVWTQRAFNLQRQGRAGTVAPLTGQEATVVGTAHALDPQQDFVFPQYREYPGLTRFGDEVLDRYVLTVRGHPAGGHFPTARVAPMQISLAAQIPHAMGYGWGLQLRGEPGVALAFFGDGASSEGDFYEAANMAGVMKTPVIFLLVNNGWAISTPLSLQSAAATFAAKADGVGMPGVRVDGNDVQAVHAAVADARRRAVEGEGPTLIEAVTYRMAPHTTADDPTRYVPAEDLETWKGRDPIEREMARLGWSAEQRQQVEEQAHLRMDRAVEWAESQPLDLAAMFDQAYAVADPDLQRQRADFVAGLADTTDRGN